MSHCNSCGAEIEWATSETTGKPVPLEVAKNANQGDLFRKPDAPPDASAGGLRGKLVVINGKARGATAEDVRLLRVLRESHFAHCPDAATWRGHR